MKRVIILIIALLLLASCSGNHPQPSEPPPDTSNTMGVKARPDERPPEIAEIADDGYDDYFVYPVDDAVYSFAVDENGIVYTAEVNSAVISAYDMYGLKLAEYEMAFGNIGIFCVGGGEIYYTFWLYNDPDDYDIGLAAYSIETGEAKRLGISSRIHRNETNYITKLAYMSGNLYMLCIMEEFITDEYNVYARPEEEARAPAGMQVYHPFIYDGRVLVKYDLGTEALELIFDTSSGVIEDFTLTSYGTVLYHAYDRELSDANFRDRFYFAEIYPETMSVGDRIYRGTGRLTELATDGWGAIFRSRSTLTNVIEQTGGIYYWSLGEDMGFSKLVSTYRIFGGPLFYYNGFTFFLDQPDGTADLSSEVQIERVRNASVLDFEPPINVISASSIGDVPRGGYNVNFSVMSPDELSLAVLSGGVSYDIAYIRTRQDFAHNIRNKGAFYPLDDVPGVREYINDCFPYVRDAATDKNGDIWMLPISINVAAVMFDEANCAQAGLDFHGAATAEDMISIINNGVNADPSGLNYVFSAYEFMKQCLSKYITTNNTLDTPAFRALAPALKELLAKGAAIGTHMPHLTADSKQPNPRFLFDNMTNQTSAHLINRDGLSITPLTGTEGTNPADVVFLCVNPNSEKLDKTLEYISYICDANLTTKTDTGLFANASYYSASSYAQKRREMYENAAVSFTVSDEVFAADFDRYLKDEIDLETLIKEAGRKLAMYLGE